MIGDVADAQVDGMLCPLSVERTLVTNIQTKDRRHVEVVDAFVVFRLRFQAGKVDMIRKRSTVFPVTALQGHRQAEALPSALHVQDVPTVEAGMELPTIANRRKPFPVRLGQGVGRPEIKIPAQVLIEELATVVVQSLEIVKGKAMLKS